MSEALRRRPWLTAPLCCTTEFVVAAQQRDAWEICGQQSGRPPLLITCEHASQLMPSPFAWSHADRWLEGTHWAYDLGAAELAAELAQRLHTVAVLSRFSRLLADPNRPAASPTLFLQRAEGRLVAMNQQLTATERTERIERLWQPYHDAVDRALADNEAPTLLAMHTFTPLYEGQRRDFEVGILFDRQQPMAQRLAAHVAAAGVSVRLNEPYSGKGGFIYSVEVHAERYHRRAIELEVRQDRAVDAAFRRSLVDCLGAFTWEQ